MYSKSKWIRKATKLFPHNPYTDRKDVKALRRGWLKAVDYLGDRWLLADTNKKTKLVEKRW